MSVFMCVIIVDGTTPFHSLTLNERYGDITTVTARSSMPRVLRYGVIFQTTPCPVASPILVP